MKVTRYYLLTVNFDVNEEGSPAPEDWSYDNLDSCVHGAEWKFTEEVERQLVVDYDIDANVSAELVPNTSG